jgi:formamidopyrimidine-DNA glycosylase
MTAMAFELPEAATVARQMQEVLRGKRIGSFQLNAESASLIRQGFINLHGVSLARETILDVSSKGKWIFVLLESGLTLCIALESGGTILYHGGNETLPYRFHVLLGFSDGNLLSVRVLGWGFVKAIPQAEIEQQRYPGRLGISPLDEAFTFEAFCRILDEAGNKNVRAALMEQGKIAGIGNAYAQEILFRAKLRPTRKVAEVDAEERRRLYESIQAILKEAVRLGGSELERDLYGWPGGYHRIVCEKTLSMPCPECGTPIVKMRLQGATTYLCPECQKR